MSDSFITGYDMGCLVMQSWVPKPPGHISCATNYDFPVFYYPVDNTNNKIIHGGEKSIVSLLVDGANELRDIGCKALVASCGYFGHFQSDIADEGVMPTYLSSVMLVPFILRTLRNDQSVILICYNKEKLTRELMISCGVPEDMLSRVHIYDVIGQPELGKIINDCGEYNISKAKDEVISVALNGISAYSDVGAILLECTDLPPHAAAIQAATNLPVFDATSMVKFIHSLCEFSEDRVIPVEGEKQYEAYDNNNSRDVNEICNIHETAGKSGFSENWGGTADNKKPLQRRKYKAVIALQNAA